MKKLNFVFAAAVSLLLAACTKEDQGIPFEKGQEVTFGISAPGQSGTKVTSELNETNIDFKWQDGDKISVKVGESYAAFDMIELSSDKKTAKFKGKMPASGDKFTVSYPVGGVDLSDQNYSATEPLPHDKMLLEGEGTLSSDGKTAEITTISAKYAVLLLNLWGADTKVTSIVVTNKSSSATYTLNCGTGVTVNTTSASPTPFRVIVPTGTYAFTAAVYGTIKDKTIPDNLICTLERTKEKAFNPGYAYKMNTWELFYPNYPGTNDHPVTLNGVTWAPVNCGYHATDYPMGRLYQWGRKYGQGYTGDADYPGKAGGTQSFVSLSEGKTGTHPDAGGYNGEFYYPIDKWYIKSGLYQFWNVPKTNYDPCPTGWRVPTYSNFHDSLLGGNVNVSTGGLDLDSEEKGFWFNGTATTQKNDGLFFPAAGCLYISDNPAPSTTLPQFVDRGRTGGYWSSGVNPYDADGKGVAVYLTFGRNSPPETEEWSGLNSSISFSYGYSVRCVLDVVKN